MARYTTDFTCRDCTKAWFFPDDTCECWRVGQTGAFKMRHAVWHICNQGIVKQQETSNRDEDTAWLTDPEPITTSQKRKR